MESRQCVICGINFDLKTENIPLTIISNKLLFDSCLHLFKIKENSYNDLYRWKWDARFDSPNFCEICCKNIQTLSGLNENLEILQKERETAALHSQIKIINSTSFEKLMLRKKFTAFRKSDSLSLIDKIDYLRSTAILALEPIIPIKKFDEKTKSDDEDIIIDIGGSRNLIQSKEDMYQFFNEVDGKFQCQICFAKISERRNVKRHFNEIHQDKRFKCAICEKKFHTKSKCKIHVHQIHNDIIPKRRIPSVALLHQIPEEVRCLLCYKSVQDEKVQIPLEVLYSFSSSLNFNPPKFMSEFAISCIGCSSYLADLHNLKCNLELVEDEFAKLLHKVKIDVLKSISSNKIQQIEGNGQMGAEKINVAAKIDHFQRLAVQDFIPVICLFNIKMGISTKAQERKRTPQDNSVFKLVKDEEIISLMDEDKMALKNEVPMENFQNDGGKYTCLVCHTFYSSYKTACDHYHKHHNQISRYQCKYCSNAFYFRYECANHIVASHKMERAEIAAEIENKLNSQSNIITTSDGVISLPNSISTANVSKDNIIKIGKEAYKCAMCSKIFKNRSFARVHQVTIHLQSYRFKCEFCGIKNYNKHPLLYHIRRVHPEKQKLIDERSNGKTAAPPPHLAKRLSKPKWTPKLNPELLRGMKVLEAKTIHNIEDYFTVIGSQYSCQTCGRAFTSRRLILGHVENIHFGVRRYQCGVCPMKFYEYTVCKKHIRKKHTNHSEFVGENENSLRESEVTKSGGFGGETDTIKDVHSKSLAVVDVNYQDDEEQQEIPLKLDIEVGEAFGCSIDIEDPFMKTEDDVQIMDLCNNNIDFAPFESEVKEENIIGSSDDAEFIVGLDSNKEMTDEKCLLYKLIKPGEIITLARSPNYVENRNKGHRKVPAGFKCLKCNKVFKKRTIFTHHWGQVHDKSIGYKCSVCQKRFYDKFHCARHFIHQHTDRNPYVCPTCDQRLNDKRNLNKHMQVHLGERRYICSICRLKFINEARLNRHIENIHNMKILGV